MPTPHRMAAARRACTLALAVVAPWATAQSVELYERPDFGGLRLTLDAASADLGRFGVGASVSSVVVTRGQWEFCTQPQYRGTCITVGPGRYARLPAGLNDNLASLRPTDAEPVRPPQPPIQPRPTRPGRAGQVGIVLYADDSRQELHLFDAVDNLSSRIFNDSATSIDVLSGQWELCSDGGYSGQCLRFGPGRYALPPALYGRLSSLRPIGPGQPGRPTTPTARDPVGPGTRPWPGATPAIVFHENRDFSGRQLPLAGAAPNFGALDFNDVASAVEVFRGRWQLCRHAGFNGDCVVLGPGRYALGDRLQNEVSSARPLSGRDDQPSTSAGAVTLHDQADFRGRSLLVEAPIGNLRDQGFNDRAVAIEVHAGQWELCAESNHRGRCLVYGPGWHRLPEGLAGALSSLRPR